ncbi:MAG: ATP-binding cassette domain-containing protein [Desulfobacteraceae bacterium]|jgi:microcin C transport system ATP-binding protein
MIAYLILRLFLMIPTLFGIMISKLPVSISIGVWTVLLTCLISIPLGIRKAVRAGQTFGVVVESGSDKTTLGMALLRLTKSIGKIVFMAKSIHDMNSSALRSMRRHMQIVFQDPYGSLSPRMTVGEIIAEGLKVHEPGKRNSDLRRIISEALVEVGLDEQMQDRLPHEFSGGQRQRIAIARAIALKPEFVILDEPTAALDRSVQSQIIDLLRDLQTRHNITYMFISHDLTVIRALSHYVLVMCKGRIVEQGPTQQILIIRRKIIQRRSWLQHLI